MAKRNCNIKKVRWSSRVRIGYHFLYSSSEYVAIVSRGLNFVCEDTKGGVCDAINKLNEEVGYKPIVIDWIIEE